MQRAKNTGAAVRFVYDASARAMYVLPTCRSVYLTESVCTGELSRAGGAGSPGGRAPPAAPTGDVSRHERHATAAAKRNVATNPLIACSKVLGIALTDQGSAGRPKGRTH